MVKESTLVAESRTGSGSAQARRLRKSGWLPGLINNEKGEARHIRLNLHDFEQRLRHHAGENLLLDMKVDDQAPQKVLLRDVQHDPLTGGLLHVDFVEVSMTRKMRVRISIILRGEPVGVLTEGGILEQLLREVEVECLPADLIESIDLDVANLHIGKRLLVSDLPLPKTLTLLTGKDVAVAAVLEPKEEEVVAAEATEVAGAEPEVIAKGKEETEEGAEGAEGAKSAGAKPAAGAKDAKAAGAAKDAKPAAGAKDAKAAGKPEDKKKEKK